MFGVSFTELFLIGAVALVVVGPNRLPMMLGTLGKWSGQLRRTLFEVRHQSGIDEILRSEGISGGLNEIRSLKNAVRGDLSSFARNAMSGPPPAPKAPASTTPAVDDAEAPARDPFAGVSYDRSREYPDEGCDAYGAIPDDLWAATRPERTAPSAASSSGAAPSAASSSLCPGSAEWESAVRAPPNLPLSHPAAHPIAAPAAPPDDAEVSAAMAPSGTPSESVQPSESVPSGAIPDTKS